MLQDILEKLDAYIISFDRPGNASHNRANNAEVGKVFHLLMFSIIAGYGESTQLRGRSYESVVSDVEDLANELGVDKFYIAAVSGGGPYALAAASMIPLRLKGLLLLSAAGSPGSFSYLNLCTLK